MVTYKSSRGKGSNVTDTVTRRGQESESVRNILEDEEGATPSSTLNVQDDYLLKFVEVSTVKRARDEW